MPSSRNSLYPVCLFWQLLLRLIQGVSLPKHHQSWSRCCSYPHTEILFCVAKAQSRGLQWILQNCSERVHQSLKRWVTGLSPSVLSLRFLWWPNSTLPRDVTAEVCSQNQHSKWPASSWVLPFVPFHTFLASFPSHPTWSLKHLPGHLSPSEGQFTFITE